MNDCAVWLNEVLERAVRCGADHAAAFLSQESSGTLRFAANHPTQHKTHRNSILSLAVSVHGKEAVTRTNLLETGNLGALAEKTVHYASNSPVNPEFFEPIGPQEYRETTAWFESTATASVAERGDVVRYICCRAESENIDMFGNLEVSSGRQAVANTSGLYTEQPVTEVTMSLSARTRHGNGSSQTHIWERDWDELHYIRAVDRMIWTAKHSVNPRRLKPGRYTVILSPKAVSEYLMFVVFAMDARMADNGQSFFGKESNTSRLNEPCFQDIVTIKSLADHPELPTPRFGLAFGSGGSEAGMLFSAGLPVQTTAWIDNGAVKNFRYSPYYACLNNRKPVAYPLNICMEGGTESLDELISGVEKGLLIESFWYVNPTDWNRLELTGLTRDGTFLIEKGAISHPVNNFRFNDSPARSLNRITGLTAPEKIYGEYWPGLIPWVRMDDFNLSSISDAV